MELLEKMSQELAMEIDYIKYCARRNNSYAKYKINKKGGGSRTILQPSKELKVLQYWICHNIFCEFPVSKFSVAYGKNCSIKKNAILHKNGKYILHTDITKFFESINRDILNRLFDKNNDIVQKLELTNEEINLILDIVLYRGEYLVVGSVASPLISNCIMYNFDINLWNKISTIMECKYSRYADDIIISSKEYIDDKVIDLIEGMINNEGFEINREKTYFMNKCCKRQITGIVIDNNNDKLSLGHKKYNSLKREIYNYLIKHIGNIEHIQGILAFVSDINRDKYEQIKDIYIRYDKDEILFHKNGSEN